MARWELLLCLTFPLAEDCNTAGAALGAGHGALARSVRHGELRIAESELRANEDTDGSWWTFGPVWKPGLKSRGRAGNILAWGVVAQIWRGGIIPPKIRSLPNLLKDGAQSPGKSRAQAQMSPMIMG